MRVLKFLLLLLCYSGVVLPATAQEAQTRLSLQADNTSLQTGQEYEVRIHIEDVTDVWLINTEIDYDPAMLYVMGSVSGSPIQPADFLDPSQSIIIRNSAVDNLITYTESLVTPAEPMSGSGVVATFRIFPLQTGTTQLRFSKGDLTKINYTETEEGRNTESTESLPFLPVLLELNISGDTVTPPPEETATPTPTFTPDPALIFDTDVTEDAEATLINVTAAPQPTLTPTPDTSAQPTEGELPILPIAIILLVIGGIGLIVLFVFARNRR